MPQELHKYNQVACCYVVDVFANIIGMYVSEMRMLSNDAFSSPSGGLMKIVEVPHWHILFLLLSLPDPCWKQPTHKQFT